MHVLKVQCPTGVLSYKYVGLMYEIQYTVKYVIPVCHNPKKIIRKSHNIYRCVVGLISLKSKRP